MLKLPFIATLLICCCTFPSFCVAEIPASLWESLTTAEQALLQDTLDGELNQHSLMEAMLLAEGLSKSEAAKWNQRYSQDAQYMLQQISAEESTEAQAQNIFRFMHREILTSEYVVDANQLVKCWEEGKYNCLSATLLYHAFCKEAGIPTRAVTTPGHIFIQLCNSGAVDVETTCPQWFELSAAEKNANHGRQREIDNRRILTETELIGKIYYNRALSSLSAEHYHAAEKELRLSLILDPADRSAKRNLLACLNNWSLQLTEERKYAEAMQLLKRASQQFPEDLSLKKAVIYTMYHWTEKLSARHQYQRGLEILSQYQSLNSHDPFFDRSRLALSRKWVEHVMENKPAEQLYVLKMTHELCSHYREWPRLESALINNHAIKLYRSGQSQKAQQLLQAGLHYQPENDLLLRNYQLMNQ